HHIAHSQSFSMGHPPHHHHSTSIGHSLTPSHHLTPKPPTSLPPPSLTINPVSPGGPSSNVVTSSLTSGGNMSLPATNIALARSTSDNQIPPTTTAVNPNPIRKQPRPPSSGGPSGTSTPSLSPIPSPSGSPVASRSPSPSSSTEQIPPMQRS